MTRRAGWGPCGGPMVPVAASGAVRGPPLPPGLATATARAVGAGPAGPKTARANAVGADTAGAKTERGAAVVELLVVFLTLLVPLVYVMVVMADVQRALLATSSAAREAGRVYVTGEDRLDAERRAALAYREVLATYGIQPGDPSAVMRLRATCPAGGGFRPGAGSGAAARPGPGVGSRPGVGAGCAGGFGPGAEVEVVVSYRVGVARVPFLGSVAGPGVTVGATHHTRVDRYRGLGG